MKSIRIFLYCLGLSTLVASCFPKASEAIRALPISSRSQIINEFSEADLKQGEAIFISRCARCHVKKEPNSRTAAEWNPILKKMIPRAKLNDEEGKLVWAYVVANSK